MQIDDTNPLVLGQEPEPKAPPVTDEVELDDIEDDIEDEDDDDLEEIEADEDDESEEDAEEEIELTEYEHDGKKYSIPKELEPFLLRTDDYTRKTQAIAEQRRELETKHTQADQRLQASEKEIELRAEVVANDQQLQRYQAVDWNAWEEQDPMAAQRGFREYQLLEKAQQEKRGELDGVQKERETAQQADFQARVQATQEHAQKTIKGWSPDMDSKITTFALEDLKLPPALLAQAIGPEVYDGLYYAWVGKQALAQQSERKPASKPKPKVQTLSKVKGKSGPTARKTMSEMSMEEYAAYRDRQDQRKKR